MDLSNGYGGLLVIVTGFRRKLIEYNHLILDEFPNRQILQNAQNKVLCKFWAKSPDKKHNMTREKNPSSSSVQHVLAIYKTRMKMQEDGITNPDQELKDLTRMIVEKLSNMPQDEELIFEDSMMKDSKGNVVAMLPKE